MKILFTGTGGVLPVLTNDATSMVVDGKLMLDFGWHGACQMEAFGYQPWNLLAGCLTHVHQDHFLGLVPLLFYYYLNQSKRTVKEPLRILGPVEGVQELVDRAMALILSPEVTRPAPEIEVIPVAPGDEVVIDGMLIQVGPSVHKTPSVSYRITEKHQDKAVSFVYSGDTGFCPELAEFAHGTNLLVHEAARGLADSVLDSAHSTFSEVCEVARQAEVDSLAMVHMEPSVRKQVMQQVGELARWNWFLPMVGDKLEVKSEGVRLCVPEENISTAQ